MRILIVEDEKGISNFLKDGLGEESFAVDVAADGNKGLELSTVNDYDLILLDWMIPGISGIEVCRQIRKSNTIVPIIFLTAKDTVSDTVFGLEAGANDYIKKPFKFEELLARIRVQLRTKEGEQTILKLGNVEMNLETHQVFSKLSKLIYHTGNDILVSAIRIILYYKIYCRKEHLTDKQGYCNSRKNNQGKS